MDEHPKVSTIKAPLGRRTARLFAPSGLPQARQGLKKNEGLFVLRAGYFGSVLCLIAAMILDGLATKTFRENQDGPEAMLKRLDEAGD